MPRTRKVVTTDVIEADEPEVQEVERAPEIVDGESDVFEVMSKIPQAKWDAEGYHAYLYQLDPPASKRAVGDPAYLNKYRFKPTLEEIKEKYCPQAINYRFMIWLKRTNPETKDVDTVMKRPFDIIKTEAEVEAGRKNSADQSLVGQLIEKLSAAQSGRMSEGEAVKQSMDILTTAYKTGLETIGGGKGQDPLEMAKFLLDVTDRKSATEQAFMVKLLDKAFGGDGDSKIGRVLDKIMDRLDRIEHGDNGSATSKVTEAIELMRAMKQEFGGGDDGPRRASNTGWSGFLQSLVPQIPKLVEGLSVLARLAVMKAGSLGPGMPAVNAPSVAAVPPYPPQFVTGTPEAPPAFDPNQLQPIEVQTPSTPHPGTPAHQAMIDAEITRLNLQIVSMYRNGRNGGFVAGVIQELVPPVYDGIKGFEVEQLKTLISETPILNQLTGDPELDGWLTEMVDYFKQEATEEQEATTSE